MEFKSDNLNINPIINGNAKKLKLNCIYTIWVWTTMFSLVNPAHYGCIRKSALTISHKLVVNLITQQFDDH